MNPSPLMEEREKWTVPSFLMDDPVHYGIRRPDPSSPGRESDPQLSSYDETLDFTGSLPNFQKSLISIELGDWVFLH